MTADAAIVCLRATDHVPTEGVTHRSSNEVFSTLD